MVGADIGRLWLGEAVRYVDESLALFLLGGRTVLVIEDDPRDLAAAIRTLSQVGVVALGADSGEDGLRLAQLGSRVVDAVLVDLGLPGMHGYEVCRRLHGPGFRCCPVPFTAAALTTARGGVMRVGAGDVLKKPLEPLATAQLLAVASMMTVAWRFPARTALESDVARRMARWTLDRREAVTLQVAGLRRRGIAAVRRVSVTSIASCLTGARCSLGLPVGASLYPYLAAEVLQRAHYRAPTEQV